MAVSSSSQVLSVFVLCIYLPFLACAGVIHQRASLSKGTSAEDYKRFHIVHTRAVALLTGDFAGSQLLEVETTLHPLFAALPKDENGVLSKAVASYALGRFFAQRRGWSTSRVESFLNQWPDTDGFSLRSLAGVIVTLEQLADEESAERVGAAFKLHRSSSSKPAALEDDAAILDSYMVSSILGRNATVVKDDMQKVYPMWGKTKELTRRILREFGDRSLIEMDDLVRATRELDRRSRELHASSCQSLKQSLLSREMAAGSGRVLLPYFYEAALDNDAWYLQKGSQELRESGALDETSPSKPSVIVANYISSDDNCIGGGSISTLCCPRPCDDVMARLEREIAAPEGDPVRIAALVESMRANVTESTRRGLRGLPAALLRRLYQVAVKHGGVIPLHGRLFAQWLHHAFPQQCPYPQLTRTPTSVQPDGGPLSFEEERLWSEQHLPTTSGRGGLAEIGRCVFLLAAFCSMLVGLKRTVQDAGVSLGLDKMV